jgi:molecular chaperone GrpE
MSDQDGDADGATAEESNDAPASADDASGGDADAPPSDTHTDDPETDDETGEGSRADDGTEPDEEDSLAALLGRSDADSETESETADTATASEHVDPASVTVHDELVDAVAETPAESLARALATLREERDRLDAALAEERERADDLESRLKRKQAEFQNYKKRQQERLEEEKARATEDLVTRLLDVRDNLQRALDQGEDADIRDGVASTLDQFDRELDRENVEHFEPEPGDEVNPRRHEALATVPSDQPEDAIAGVHRSGYLMADKVLRPAQVTVSEGPADESADGNGEADNSKTDETESGDPETDETEAGDPETVESAASEDSRHDD